MQADESFLCLLRMLRERLFKTGLIPALQHLTESKGILATKIQIGQCGCAWGATTLPTKLDYVAREPLRNATSCNARMIFDMSKCARNMSLLGKLPLIALLQGVALELAACRARYGATGHDGDVCWRNAGALPDVSFDALTEIVG